jgi:hypothetical protein
MESEIKSGSVDWHLFRKNIRNQEFYKVTETVDGWQDIDAIKLVVFLLCEALERIKEAEK